MGRSTKQILLKRNGALGMAQLVKCLEPIQKSRYSGAVLRRWIWADPWGLLLSWPALPGELQTNETPCIKGDE